MVNRSLTHGVATVIFLVGVASLLGWWLDSELLKRGISDGVAMNPATAVSFLLVGTAVWLLRAEPVSRARSASAMALAGSVALVALTTLAGYLLGAEAVFDQLLFSERLHDEVTGRRSRMAPSAALGFLLLASALALLDVKTAKGRRPSQILSLAVGVIAAVALFEYATSVSLLVGASIVPMAFNTAATFLLCSVALVAARPGRGMLGTLAAWPLSRRVNVGFGSALAVLALVSVATAWSSVRAAAAFEQRLATNERRFELLQLSRLVDQGVRGERGLLLTADTAFLNPYLVARDSLETVVAKVTRHFEGLPTEAPRTGALRRLVRDAAALSALTVDLAQRGDQRAAAAVVRQGRGKALIDAIHDTVRVLLHHDEARAAAVDLAARAADRLSLVTSVSAGALALVLLLGAVRTINRDIVQRLQAETALRESENRLFQILDAIPVGVFVVDREGKSYYANQAAKGILGAGIDRDVQADRLAERYSVLVAGTNDPYPPERIPFAAALAGQTVRPRADAAVHRPDRIVPIEFSAAPVRDAEGRVTFAVCVFSDITERRELENLRDNLVHMLVHDLRSPLTAIRAYLDLVKLDAGQLDPDVVDSIDHASAATTQMTEMVSDLIDVSRLESGAMPLKRSAVNLIELTREAMGTVGAHTQRLPVRLDRPTQTIMLSCDGTVIRRVIANLLANAMKVTPPTGEVRIAIEEQPGCVRLTVRDTGPGIAPEHHARIFEKFGQVETAHQGPTRSSGLGLTFCKLAVEAHGGRIGVESALGSGSTFWFELPR